MTKQQTYTMSVEDIGRLGVDEHTARAMNSPAYSDQQIHKLASEGVRWNPGDAHYPHPHWEKPGGF